MSGTVSGTGNSRAPLSDRKDDLYETPGVAVTALLRHEKLPKNIWEPACGPGAIVRELRAAGKNVLATDLIDYETPDQDWARRDFLMEHKLPDGIEAIVTNPPFKNAESFVSQALHLCPKVYMLLRLAFLESERRRPILDDAGLTRVLVFRKRLPMMHRAGWEGKKASSGMAFAWFVWERGAKCSTELKRISWEQLAE